MATGNNAKQSYSTRGSRVAIGLSIVSFVIYLLNVVVGKASIIYGWNIFKIGSVGEFLILFFASTTFIVAGLLQEAAWKAIHEPPTK